MIRPSDSQGPKSVGTAGLDRLAVAAALRDTGRLLALEGTNRFRARAYERGARAVERLTADLGSLARAGHLTAVPGIGRALAATITELVTTGRSEQLERLRSRFPPGASELGSVLSLPRIRAVHEALGIATLDELRDACDAGRLREVRGFGPKVEQRLRERIAALADPADQVLLPVALQQADAMIDDLRTHPAVGQVEIAGSLRRRVEVIERLDVVVATADPAAVIAHVTRLPATTGTHERHADGVLLTRAGELDTWVRVTSDAQFAVAWLDATGSAGHVAGLARRAAERGVVLESVAREMSQRRRCTESDLYAALAMRFVPPELREDAGEIEAAVDGSLPADLVQLEDLQGAVHCHTDYSDGRHSVEQMARAADALGLRYLTITDHSASATYAGGLDVDRLRRQWDEIARVQERVRVRLLRGTESDILRDGALDYPDRVLERLEVVIASVHNRHGLDARQMTRRLVRAMRHPIFKIWGHALGRYVLSRPPFACDVEEVLDAIAESRAAIEVNGDPHRLDLEPRWIRSARRRGIRFVVSSDAHSVDAIRNARFGVDMARRGWLRRADVLNTLPADDFVAAVRP
jgi:DNA polymerase (family 10)